jgi:hypothetical protein
VRPIDKFYLDHGKPCCAGCDWWQPHNSVTGECTKSAPVPGYQRTAMIGMESCSAIVGPGHITTPREHSCGDFVDSYDWVGGGL